MIGIGTCLTKIEPNKTTEVCATGRRRRGKRHIDDGKKKTDETHCERESIRWKQRKEHVETVTHTKHEGNKTQNEQRVPTKMMSEETVQRKRKNYKSATQRNRLGETQQTWNGPTVALDRSEFSSKFGEHWHKTHHELNTSRHRRMTKKAWKRAEWPSHIRFLKKTHVRCNKLDKKKAGPAGCCEEVDPSGPLVVGDSEPTWTTKSVTWDELVDVTLGHCSKKTTNVPSKQLISEETSSADMV